MSNSKWVFVKNFAVRLPSGNNFVNIYANGNMQAEVIVDIEVVDKNGTPVKLSQYDLDRITLIDYNTTNAFIKGWSYSQVENIYSHNIGTDNTKLAKSESSTTQSFSFWVCSTVSPSVLSVAASIVMPDGSTLNTNSNFFDSHVDCISQDEIAYTLTNTILTRFNTASIPAFSDGVKVDQDNSYVSLTNSNPITSVNWINGPLNVFAQLNANEFYAWPLEASQTQTVSYQSAQQIDTFDIIINDKKGSVSFSRLGYAGTAVNFSNQFSSPVTFILADNYGNRGAFTVSPAADKNTIQIQEYTA